MPFVMQVKARCARLRSTATMRELCLRSLTVVAGSQRKTSIASLSGSIGPTTRGLQLERVWDWRSLSTSCTLPGELFPPPGHEVVGFRFGVSFLASESLLPLCYQLVTTLLPTEQRITKTIGLP